MMRIVWLTDIHLNFLRPGQIHEFLQSVSSHEPDAVLISGDIGEATDVTRHLREIDGQLRRPVFFVLGNHDFYHGSISQTRKKVETTARNSEFMTWLSTAGIVELTSTTGLVGHDSWADGRYGDYENSTVELNDYVLIQELTGLTRRDRLGVLNRLGDEAATYLSRVLPEALKRYTHVILLTHVPPFKEASWYNGKPSGDDGLPHFACKAVGDALLEIMNSNRDARLTVLCGHTHENAQARFLPNLHTITGGAKYGQPSIQKIIEIP
jgi:predicted MPP superfamily phosphohydrolase